MVDVRPDEVRALLLSCLYFFCLLSAYYIIRPMREQMGVTGGVRNLPWLYTGTLLSMLAVHPPFAALVARLPRRRFITLSYRFFAANILAFFLLFHVLGDGTASVWAGRIFFVWTSVFNLFVVSVFWAFMVDIFRGDQARRLFGFIGVGGTLGGIAGAALTAGLAERVGPDNLLLVSALLLEVAVQCVRRLADSSVRAEVKTGEPFLRDGEAVIGGRVLAGIWHVLRSPYLLGICVYMLLFTFGSTVLYFLQAQIADKAFSDRASLTAFFASLDLAVNVLTLVTQAFLTGRIIRLIGVTMTLGLLPILSIVGFTALGAVPVLAVFVVFQVLRRAGEYAVARPAREVLYTAVSREDKYKAKHFIDTFVYRAGDQVGAWSMAGMTALGLGVTGSAFVAAPFAAVWLVVALWLGRKHRALGGTAASAAV